MVKTIEKMKNTFNLFVIALMSTTTFYAQEVVLDWENPEIFAVNLEKTRATSIPYTNEDAAIIDLYEKSPYYQSLNGEWKFQWVPTVADIPADFYSESFIDEDWATIPVPGNWEFNGYGTPMYVNIGFGFSAKPPHIDPDFSPVGTYRHTFTIPENWSNRRVFLHFEGGTNFMYVYVNGQKVGINKNDKSPTEFDITPYIREGENLLACQVHKFSDGSYLEDQDKWRLAGFNRNVYLYSTDDTRIRDFFAKPDLDKNYENGIFSIDVSLKIIVIKKKPGRLLFLF